MNSVRGAFLFVVYLFSQAVCASSSRLVFECELLTTDMKTLVDGKPKIAVWRANPSATPIGQVIIAHGVKEHSGWHQPTVDALTANGLVVYRFDLRGHGHSGGPGQSINKFQDYVDDLYEVVTYAQKMNPDLPVFVKGYSMGGTVVVHLAEQHPEQLTGIILEAPAYSVGKAISKAKIVLHKVAATAMPNHKIYNPMDKAHNTSDEEFNQRKKDDKLNYDFLTARQGINLLRAMKNVERLAPQIKVPVFIAHGTKDDIVQPEGSRRLYDLFGSADKTLKFFPDAYHELHNDPESKAAYFTHVNNWINARITSK